MTDATQRLSDALAGSYRIDRELGQGGMATVYLARDLRHDRQVALKVIRSDLTSSISEERFSREIRLAARLQHPHICSVYDSGRTAEGQLWFAMPFINGESLRERLLREHTLPVPVAVRIVREAAQALEYAHRQGVVHRDIKPENILLTEDGSTLVADFGIARSLSPSQDPAMAGQSVTHLTETGVAVGSPAYMSPEQRMGVPVDHRSDIYSLAATLYEALLGERHAGGGSGLELFLQQMTDPVPRLRVKRSDIPEGVEVVVRKALQPDPAQRFPTMAGFASALEGALSGQYRAGRTGRRSWLQLTGVAVLVVGAAIAGLSGWNRYRAFNRPITVAVLPFTYPASDQALRDLTDGFSEDMRRILYSLPNTHVTGTETTRRVAAGGRFTPAELTQRLNAQLIVAPVAERKGDSITVSFTVDEPDRGIRNRRVTITGTEQFLIDRRDSLVGSVLAAVGRSPEPDVLRAAAGWVIRTRVPQTYRQYSNFAFQRAEQIPYDGIEGLKQFLNHNDSLIAQDPTFLDAISDRALFTFQMAGDFGHTIPAEETARLLQAGRDLVRRAQAVDPTDPLTYRANAFLLLANGDTLGAIGALRQAASTQPDVFQYAMDLCLYELAKLPKSAPPPAACGRVVALDSLNPNTLMSVGWILQSNLRFDAAEAVFRQCISLSPAGTWCYSSLGDLLQRQGRYEEALVPLRQASRIDPQDVQNQITLSVALAGTDQLDEAVAELRKAVGSRWNDRDFERFLVHVLVKAGRTQEAIAAAREMIQRSPKLPLAQLALADALWADRQFEPALNAVKAAIAINPNTLDSWHQYAWFNRLLGRVADAQQATDRMQHLDPKSWLTIRAGAEQQLWLGQPGRALEVLSNAPADSSDARPLIMKAWAELQAGESREALATIRLARQRDSVVTDWSPVLALVYSGNGMRDDAIKAIDRFRRFDPWNQFQLASQIWIYARNGRREAALRLLDTLEVRRKRVAPSLMPLLVAYSGVSDTTRAAALLTQAVANRDWEWTTVGPADPFLDILRQRPEYQAAVRAFRQGGDR